MRRGFWYGCGGVSFSLVLGADDGSGVGIEGAVGGEEGIVDGGEGKGWVEGLGDVGVGRMAEESSHRII
ncbi:hypothetical protein FCV25MIE_09543 [Fagus crenata]